jgi:protoheme IX farnesyltransferase
MTTAAGFYVARPQGPDWAVVLAFLHTLLGTALVAGGTNALNQIAERDVDAVMRRTAGRPLPTGRVGPGAATAFAWALGIAGIVELSVFLNLLTGILAAATLLTYVFAYTPLKRTTELATLVGAVPGALPILGGWTAAGGVLGPQAWTLFWIMFLWQLPHFLALAWVYREDYRRAGLRMLSVEDEDGRRTFRQASLYAVALLPVSLAPTLLGVAGAIYFFGATVLSLWLIWAGVAAALDRSTARARRLFTTSVAYLPLLLLLMVVDRAG